MPTYIYACQDGHRLERICTIAEMEDWEHRLPFCRHCGHSWRRDYGASVQRPVVFHEGFYEHVSPDGAQVSNMSDLRRIAKENGNYSNYAEDLGGLFRAKEGRWI